MNSDTTRLPAPADSICCGAVSWSAGPGMVTRLVLVLALLRGPVQLGQLLLLHQLLLVHHLLPRLALQVPLYPRVQLGSVRNLGSSQ